MIETLSGPKKRAIVLLFLMIHLVGCASQSSFSRSFPDRLTEAQNEWRFKKGAYFNPSPVSQPPKLNDSAVLDGPRVQQILERLVYVSPLRGYPIRMGIINSPKINAFTDGGSVFITTGLLETFQGREDLVASVLAHELGHILANHIPAEKSRSTGLLYLSYLTPALGVLPFGGIYGSLSGTALRQGAKIRDISYSRLQENEADSIGVIIADRAGYNAHGLSDFFDVVASSGFGRPQVIQVPLSLSSVPESAAVTLLSSSPLYRAHPPSEKRKKTVKKVLQRRKGEITQEELRKESRWLANLYETLDRRMPKE